MRHVAAEGLPRVADVRGGDLDGDGDQDLAVAAFGYDHGQTLWLENRGKWSYAVHVLQELSGAVNVLVADFDRSGTLDIAALISQEWEEIWMFDNAGGGRFTPRLVWGSSNADFGSSWLAPVDLDRDGDIDLLYSNGDAFDYAPANSRPWHGVQWLENQGANTFALHRIGDLRARRARWPFDADQDGDLDVAVVSAYNAWSDPAALSLDLAGEQRPPAVHDARRRARADASHHARGRGSGRQRDARPRDRRHAHQRAVRPDVAGDAVDQWWRDAVSPVARRCRDSLGLGTRGSGAPTANASR